MDKNNFISIVIPAYNEEKNIRLGSLDKVFRYFEHPKFRYEILIVNDGSTDGTGQLLDKLAKTVRNLTVIHNPHAGKANTVITGMSRAKGEIVLFTDLDQATPINELEKIIPWFAKGYGVVIGSRNRQRQGAPILRIIMARGFMILREVVLGLKGLTDTQCGFKAFTRDAVKSILPQLKLYSRDQLTSGSMVTAGFDVELLYIASILGYKIKEVPVEWHYVETRRVNPIKESVYGLADIIKIKLNAISGRYQIKS